MKHQPGWIAVDLDGTLAEYDGWKGCDHIGEPVEKMAERVRDWLKRGMTVKIFTARVSPAAEMAGEADGARRAIWAWSEKHFGVALPITATKDFAMVQLWDDRCVQVIENTGVRADGKI